MNTILFPCGFGSGGTDLTKNVLNAHPDIYIASEVTSLASIYAKGYNSKTKFSKLDEVNSFRSMLKRLQGGHVFENIEYDFKNVIEKKEIIELEDVVRRLLSHKEKKVTIWGAKLGVEEMDILSDTFPRAKFILVTRDVRDVCLSWDNKWGKDKLWCASKWAKRMDKGWKFAALKGPEACLVIKFEDLITDTEIICNKICDFLDIPYSDRMLHYHMYTDHWKGKRNYGQPIISSNREKWRAKLTKKTIRRIEEIAFNTMDLLGYKPEIASKAKNISHDERFKGICHDFLAILFIGNRTLKERNTMQVRLKTAYNVARGLFLRKGKKK